MCSTKLVKEKENLMCIRIHLCLLALEMNDTKDIDNSMTGFFNFRFDMYEKNFVSVYRVSSIELKSFQGLSCRRSFRNGSNPVFQLLYL